MKRKIVFRMRRAVFNPYKKNIAGEPVRMAELLLSKNGFSIAPDSQGNLGIFRADGTELGYWTQDRFIFIGQGTPNLEIYFKGQNAPLFSGDAFIGVRPNGALDINSGGSGGNNPIYFNADIINPIIFWQKTGFNQNVYQVYGINTVGLGIEGIYGIDNRTGLTGVDASPITLYPQSSLLQPAIASGQLYRLSGRILATAGTGPSATYQLKWTEGGVVITKSLTISALDSDADFSALIQPDPNTSITAQLTAISGTGTTVNVAASVERLA